MNNEKQLLMIKTKEDAIRDEIKELIRLYDLNDIKNYRSFNNVFISSVRTLIQILNRTVTAFSAHTSNFIIPINFANGEEVSPKEFDRLTKLNPFINEFMEDMIEKFTDKSKKSLELNRNTNDVDKFGYSFEKTDHLPEYKYMQQIIDDYMKLLLN